MTYVPTNQFEQYVVDEFKQRHKFENNHLSHHSAIYGRLWWVVGALFVSILGLYLRG